MSDIDNNAPTTAEFLWRTYASELLRFASVLVGPIDAGDVVVEAVMKADSFITAGAVESPRAYLFRAVANQAADLKRARQRRWSRDLAAVGPANTTQPDTFIDVRRAVAQLSVAQRAVVYLAYWEDMTERDIAEVLQVSPGTVHRNLTVARAQLGKALR